MLQYPRRFDVFPPQFPARLDVSNPVTRGLIFAAEPAAYGHMYAAPNILKPGTASFEPLLAGVTLGSRTGTVAKNVFSQPVLGRAYNFSGSQVNRSCSFGLFQGLVGATQASWHIRFYSGANPTTHAFGQWDSNLYWLFQLSSAGNFLFVVADDQAGNRTRYDSTGGPFAAAGWHDLILSWRGSPNTGTSRSLLCDGAFLGALQMNDTQTAASNIDNRTNTADYLQLGMVSGGTAMNGSIAFARIWNRGLSDAEMLSLAWSPYQIWQSPLRRGQFAAASALNLMAQACL